MNKILNVRVNWREGFANHPEVIVQVDELEMVAGWKVIFTKDNTNYNVQESTCGNFRFYNVTRVDNPKNWGASRSSHFNFALGVIDEEGFIDVEVNESEIYTLHPQKRLCMGVKMKFIKEHLLKEGVHIFQRIGSGESFDKDNDFEISASSRGLFKPDGSPFGNEAEYPVKLFV